MIAQPIRPSQRRSRLQLLLLFLLFGAPFVAAYVAFYLLPQFTPQGRLNYGTLIDPARPMPVIGLRDVDGKLLEGDALRGKWTLLHLVRKSCEEACLRELILSRQTRAAMNRDNGRVRRLLIAGPNVDLAALQAKLGAEEPDLHYAQEAAAEPYALPLFAATPDNAILILDPFGNWLMYYPPAGDAAAVLRDFKGLQNDLHKLLKLSHIG